MSHHSKLSIIDEHIYVYMFIHLHVLAYTCRPTCTHLLVFSRAEVSHQCPYLQ